MSTGWENHESAPIEYFHGKLMDYFHEWRVSQTDDITIPINGSDLSKIIAKAKTDTYAKYPKQVSSKPILKSEM